MARGTLLLAWLRLGAVWAGSGCNEQVKDLGPWIASVEVEKTEEGYTLLLELEGGDVAASSTESVELLVGREALGQRTKHFVLPKASSKKGGLLELRAEEDLLGGVAGSSFSLQATLQEYNGNNHGPESLACRAGEEGRQRCHRAEKAVPTDGAPAGAGGAGGMEMMGGGPMHMGQQHMRSGAQRTLPVPSPPRAAPAPARHECHPGSAPCSAGSICQVSRNGNYICFKELEPNLRRSFAKPSSGHGFRMIVAGALFVCLSCLCGALFLHRFALRRDARSFDSMPKVVGKVADGSLSTVETMKRSRAREEDSDSDDGFRVW